MTRKDKMQVSGDPTSQLGCVCFEPGGSPPGPRFPRRQGTFGNSWRQFWLSAWRSRRGVTGIWPVEFKDTAEHFTMHGTAPATKD